MSHPPSFRHRRKKKSLWHEWVIVLLFFGFILGSILFKEYKKTAAYRSTLRLEKNLAFRLCENQSFW